MDSVMDLAARAVSFITLIQDTTVLGSVVSGEEEIFDDLVKTFDSFPSKYREFINSSEHNRIEFSNKAVELVWVSSKAPVEETAILYSVKLAGNLIGWIGLRKEQLIGKLKPYQSFPTPYNWRQAISEILYEDTGARLALATALQYLPIQIVLALGSGKYDAPTQRILQVWRIDETDKQALLTASEQKLPSVCRFDADKAAVLIQEDKELLKMLLEGTQPTPLPFEDIFRCELREIDDGRESRAKELHLLSIEPILHQNTGTASDIDDPFLKAKTLQLSALAFSGGGIRSATFNLGILQAVAKKGLLSNFDYMSTVSGGGYIGSWLAAWIKRDGSVIKVSNRLNPEKSCDPSGEELRPIRWLRMFSNYFTPQSSIMSVDSWTVGVTWLRNMLLNQLIILNLLLTILVATRLCREFWTNHIHWNGTTPAEVSFWSIILLLPVSLLVGLGMQAYTNEKLPLNFKAQHTNKISVFILALGLVGAYFVSAWVFSRSHLQIDLRFTHKLISLLPAAIVTFITLTLVAILGRYDKCIKAFAINNFFAWLYLILTAAIAAFIGLLGLALTWTLMQTLSNIPPSKTGAIISYADVAFTCGLPIVLEVFSITVVTRMALLGRYFPDERREWWGRMGAIIHRMGFIWFLAACSLFLGQKLFMIGADKWRPDIKLAFGGWAALVASSVKAAFGSNSSGKEGSKTALSIALNMLGKIGPYLFVLGLLIFLPLLIDPLLKIEKKIFTNIEFPADDTLLNLFILMVVIGIPTYLLSRQVGVNEFSMHHFYRNRLVRAYLGATRRRTDREKTANPFTGFDKEDDIKLSEFKNKSGYYGPYPILNTALNATQVTELDRQDRKAESFIFSPLFCGFDFSVARASADVKTKSYDYAYRQTEKYAYPDGPGIGTAMAISGAAVNPNQGYHSSPATAFLLTVFNAQMGWWIATHEKRSYKYSDPRSGLAYIFYNLVGKSDTRKNFVSLSDGGHFDNMGLYELVRRRCHFIVLGDGEQDDRFTCEGLANAIRLCRIDFGTEIEMDVQGITNRDEQHHSDQNYAVGRIRYPGDSEPSGTLLYIKSSIIGDEPVDVREYSVKNPSFPHQSTADQFFDEAQFESYRKLGMHIADRALADDRIDKLLNIKK